VVVSPHRSGKVLVALIDELPPSDTLLDISVSVGDNDSLRDNNEIALFFAFRQLFFSEMGNARGIGIDVQDP